MKRLTLFLIIVLILLGTGTGAMAAPVDLIITDFMFAPGYQPPPDETSNHMINMTLKNGEYQGSPNWQYIGSDTLADKTSGIIGADYGIFGPIGVLTQAADPTGSGGPYPAPSI